jgi:hypothetical protein
MSDCLLKRDWGPDFRLWHATSFRCDAKADAIRAKRTFRGWREQEQGHPIRLHAARKLLYSMKTVLRCS